MEELIQKYVQKLIDQGLARHNMPVMAGIDADLIWNRDAAEKAILEEVISSLNINSVLFSEPAEPYRSIIDFLTSHMPAGESSLCPEDSETRTFLHDIPVIVRFKSDEIMSHLKKRKAVIVAGRGIVTSGTVSPEQAFITFSSVCFSCYVKFFTDYYYVNKKGRTTEAQKKIISSALRTYESFQDTINFSPSKIGPFNNADETVEAMAETGRMTVHSGMVDSFFGNISYRLADVIYISQTGSSLDELEGNIDACPMDGSTTAAITASSEFSAHKAVYRSTGFNAILHGHPKFSVIMSMLCDNNDCEFRDQCYKRCPEKRSFMDIPIVPGEVGTGPAGISATLPAALKGRGAIVYGHGLFTTGSIDFREAFQNLLDIETSCLSKYRDLCAV